jgi:hypothetical protein
MKHEFRRKEEKDFPKMKIVKEVWYNNKTCRHKKIQALYSIQIPFIVL